MSGERERELRRCMLPFAHVAAPSRTHGSGAFSGGSTARWAVSRPEHPGSLMNSTSPPVFFLDNPQLPGSTRAWMTANLATEVEQAAAVLNPTNPKQGVDWIAERIREQLPARTGGTKRARIQFDPYLSPTFYKEYANPANPGNSLEICGVIWPREFGFYLLTTVEEWLTWRDDP